jgi:hypothetical protein
MASNVIAYNSISKVFFGPTRLLRSTFNTPKVNYSLIYYPTIPNIILLFSIELSIYA